MVTGYLPYQSGEYYNPLQIAHFRFYAPNSTVGEIYLDNTRNLQMKMTADKAPSSSEDDLPPGHGNDDNLTDPNGWAK